MRLIVGLGNPGRDYEHTRHNVGFMAADRLAARHGLSRGRSKFQGQVCEGPIAGAACTILKPATFMNRSGVSVGQAVRFYKLELEDLLILVDDTALPAGRIRLRAEGGAGGHNGLGDIEGALGTTAYPRLRLGIDQPDAADRVDHVLGRIRPAEKSMIETAMESACDAAECWIRDGIDKAMSLFNA